MIVYAMHGKLVDGLKLDEGMRSGLWMIQSTVNSESIVTFFSI